MTTLNDALVQIIQSTQGAVEKGIGFLSAQIPDVIQQLLLWKFVEAMVYGLIGVVLAVLVGLLARAVLKTPVEVVPEGEPDRWSHRSTKYVATLWRDDEGKLEDTCIFAFIFAFFGIPTSILFMFDFTTALQIWLAPKVFLIEYASHLVK